MKIWAKHNWEIFDFFFKNKILIGVWNQGNFFESSDIYD